MIHNLKTQEIKLISEEELVLFLCINIDIKIVSYT